MTRPNPCEQPLPPPSVVSPKPSHEPRPLRGIRLAIAATDPALWVRGAVNLHYRAKGSRAARDRDELVAQLSGEGIEIGALHNPLRVGPECRVTYVDRFSNHDQRQLYPELGEANLVQVGLVAAANDLSVLGGESQDFVIANQVIEHVEDPIGALREWHRVLKPGGHLFLAVPDKNGTFDLDRDHTSLLHCLRDHVDSGAGSRFRHYREWAERVNGLRSGIEKRARIQQLVAQEYPIHFHVWSEARFAVFSAAVFHLFRLKLELVAHVPHEPMTDEFVLLYRRA